MVVLNDFHFCLLESFLNQVKANGGETESDDILAIDGCVDVLPTLIPVRTYFKQFDREFISSLSHGIEGPVRSAIKILRILKDMDIILNALRKAVKNGLSMAQKELLPVTRHHGILSLPLEIVAQIFRRVREDDAYCATQSIPLVNHYFRDVAVGTPELWTHLTPSRNPRLFMERSKSLGLEVDLTEDLHYIDFLEMVAPEAERWTSLSFPVTGFQGKEDLQWTRDVLAGNTFTALRELCMEGDYYNDYRSLFDLSYDEWKMPSLRRIKTENTLPSIQLASSTCLHLIVGGASPHFCPESIDLEEITTFLQPMPLLTELSLDIGWFDEIAFCTGIEATLPNVKTLRLKAKLRGAASSCLTDFLASLRMPRISDLSVDIVTYRACQLTDWVGMIFPKGDSFWPSIETLDLSMSYELRDYDADDEYDRDGAGTSAPNDLLERIPAVRRLSIRAIDIHPPFHTDRPIKLPNLRTLNFGDDCPPRPTDWNIRLPNLRTLSFRDCNEFDTRFIMDIREMFEAPEFETLKIHNCKSIDAESVRKMMPEGKAFVSTVD